jgi:hypothetical protein
VRRPGRSRVGVVRTGPPPAPQAATEQDEDDGCRDRADHGRNERQRRDTGARDDGGGGQHAAIATTTTPRAAQVLEHSPDRRGDDDGEAEPREEGDLVVRAERRDRELFEGLGDDVDHEAADRQDRAGAARDEQRQQLGDAEEHRTADEAREGGEGERRAPAGVRGHDDLLPPGSGYPCCSARTGDRMGADASCTP